MDQKMDLDHLRNIRWIWSKSPYKKPKPTIKIRKQFIATRDMHIHKQHILTRPVAKVACIVVLSVRLWNSTYLQITFDSLLQTGHKPWYDQCMTDPNTHTAPSGSSTRLLSVRCENGLTKHHDDDKASIWLQNTHSHMFIKMYGSH